MVIQDRCAKCLLVGLLSLAALIVRADEPAWIDVEAQIRPEVVASDSRAFGSPLDAWWRFDFVVQGVKRGVLWILR